MLKVKKENIVNVIEELYEAVLSCLAYTPDIDINLHYSEDFRTSVYAIVNSFAHHYINKKDYSIELVMLYNKSSRYFGSPTERNPVYVLSEKMNSISRFDVTVFDDKQFNYVLGTLHDSERYETKFVESLKVDNDVSGCIIFVCDNENNVVSCLALKSLLGVVNIQWKNRNIKQ